MVARQYTAALVGEVALGIMAARDTVISRSLSLSFQSPDPAALKPCSRAITKGEDEFEVTFEGLWRGPGLS